MDTCIGRKWTKTTWIWLIVCYLPQSIEYCNFPTFLWSPVAPDSVEKLWMSRATHSPFNEGTSRGGSGAPTSPALEWSSQYEMTARATQIAVKNVTRAVCLDQHTNSTTDCLRRDLLHRIVCLMEEFGDKFRVQIIGSGNADFSCMKFVSRGRNVVQVWAAAPSKTNVESLCHSTNLHRDPWPWIVHRKEQWSFCPFVGGFDFRVNVRGRKKVVCAKSKHQWRPSRLESECILGEGIHVQFPDDKCSSLEGDFQDGPLYCWGSWTEDQFEFVLIGRRDHSLPHAVMRLPTNSNSIKEFDSDLYYAPVTPVDEDRVLLSDVYHVNLHMIRSDPGVCYDESELCQQFARRRKCVNSALHKFANFCKKSCGLCGHKADLVPSVRSECYFPDEYRGSWLLMESDRVEEVTVEAGHVNFSRLGSFICKSKHWKRDQYKMFSVYDNGCRPRFSCMHFRLDGIILQFQLSRSSELDKSFDLCDFRDDPEPLRDKIRSRKMKLLLPAARVRYGHCGLDGRIPINASFPGEEVTCTGYLSDWNPEKCHSVSNLTLVLPDCTGTHAKEYLCYAQMDITDGTALLITRKPFSHLFQCWVLHTHSERMAQRPWRQASVFDKGQCGSAHDFSTHPKDSLVMSIVTRTTVDNFASSCVSPLSVNPRPLRPIEIRTLPTHRPPPGLQPTPAGPRGHHHHHTSSHRSLHRGGMTHRLPTVSDNRKGLRPESILLSSTRIHCTLSDVKLALFGLSCCYAFRYRV